MSILFCWLQNNYTSQIHRLKNKRLRNRLRNNTAQCNCDPKTRFHSNEYFLLHWKLLSNNWVIFILNCFHCLQTLNLNYFLDFIYNCFNEIWTIIYQTYLKLLGSLCFAFSHCFNSECMLMFDPNKCMK